MTIIASTIWGGRICTVVDRRISQRLSNHGVAVIDDESNKLIVVQCRNALLAITYTGVAVAHQTWMDHVIAQCLAHRKLQPTLIQPGSRLLARPPYVIIEELQVNLNGALNTDRISQPENIDVLIQGWEFGRRRLIPFSCQLQRGAVESNGNRYLKITHHAVAKHFRSYPTGLWGKILGDEGGAMDKSVDALQTMVGVTHDDVERHLQQAVRERSRETSTVSPSCVAIQLDPRVNDGQVQFTYYPHEHLDEGHPSLSPWVMTPRMICAPSTATSANLPISECGKYMLGGFSDGNTNLHVVTRLPAEHRMRQDSPAINLRAQVRPQAPRA